jgi:CheY-like chemotaxis protein
MRASIDCAVLMVPAHKHWVDPLLAPDVLPNGRFKLHPLGLDGTAWPSGRVRDTGWSADVLRKAALQLKRYDVCLLPIALDTLAWTRLALANAREVIDTPLVGISRDLKAAGLQDLLALGMADFLRHPVCTEELKIRLAQRVAASPAVSVLNDSAVDRARMSAARIDQMVQTLLSPAAGEPFRAAKARIVTEFERQYVNELLLLHQGNISQAAKAANKNRRAFWELMRKHEIGADLFR